MTIHRKVVYAGRVQGVGFRYKIKQIAAGYAVVGWVRNLSDGRVELQIGGENDEVDAFLSAVAGSQLAHNINETLSEEVPAPTTAWTGFEIRH